MKVWFEGDDLVFRGISHPQQDPHRMKRGSGIVVGGLVVAWFAPLLGGVLVLIGLATMVSLFSSSQPGLYTTREGQLFERAEPILSRRVRVTGTLGGRQHLYVGTHPVWWANPQGLHGDGVAVDAVTWLATHLADQLGVEVEDKRDLPLLRRWESDPAFRGHELLNAELRRCRSAHRPLYDLVPVEPARLTTLSSATYRIGFATLELTATHVENTPLHTLDELFVLISDSGARLVGRSGARRVQLLEVVQNGEEVARLLFVAERVQEAIDRAVDPGSRDDVPSSMGRLREQ